MRREVDYIPYEKSVRVNEHKAATDESIKLLNEFQEKAKENLCYSVSINQTFIHAIAFWFTEQPHLNGGFEVFYKFALNGSEFKVKTFISDDEYYEEQMKHPIGEPAMNISVKLIYESISQEITKELLNQTLPKLNKHINNR